MPFVATLLNQNLHFSSSSSSSSCSHNWNSLFYTVEGVNHRKCSVVHNSNAHSTPADKPLCSLNLFPHFSRYLCSKQTTRRESASLRFSSLRFESEQKEIDQQFRPRATGYGRRATCHESLQKHYAFFSKICVCAAAGFDGVVSPMYLVFCHSQELDFICRKN